MSKLHPQMNFEGRIIDAILNCIKDNQLYLTQPENLPQLAKLGFMYNTLWYSGRHASSEGIISKEVYVEDDGETWESEQCGDNPKYKIEMCDPENEDIENYIYDAWGMHVMNDYGPSWEEFSQIVLKGKPLTEIEIKMLKPNKTFDEWVEILTDPEYRYSSIYPNRRAVANHMLCTIGNGYGYKNGYVINEASGADQDSTDYGDWMNCTFREDIQELVNEIMADAEVEKIMLFISGEKIKHQEKEEKKTGMSNRDLFEKISDKFSEEEVAEIEKHIESDNFLSMLLKLMQKKNDGEEFELEEIDAEPYRAYYPISNYSKITMFDKDTHPSYINAAIEICNEILAHREEELAGHGGKNNIAFAERFLKKMGNNFVEVHEEKTITPEELKVKIQQLKSSFSVEGIPLIKSNRFTQEEYDAMKAKSKAHKPYWDHLKEGKKIWSDEEIGEQIRTLILQKHISNSEFKKFIKDYKANHVKGQDLKKDLAAYKKALFKLVGWDKLKPLDTNFWTRFSAAPYSMKWNHVSIGEVEKGYGAVGMEDIFDDAFERSSDMRYGINNELYYFEQEWKPKKQKA